MANQLNETSKALLRELEIEDLRAQTVNRETIEVVQQTNAAIAKDLKSFYASLNKAVRVANCEGANDFFEQITTNQKVATGEKTFDKDAFNADFEQFKNKYNKLAKWLNDNIPKNLLCTSELMGWQKKHLEFLQLQKQQPNKNDAKYFKDTFEQVPMSGTDALNIVRNIKNTFDNELENTLKQFIEEDKMQFQKVHFNDDEWNFLKMAYKFGLTNCSEFMIKIKSHGLNSQTFGTAILFDSFDLYLEDRAQQIINRKHKITTNYLQSGQPDNDDAMFVTKSRLLKTLNTNENNMAIQLLMRYETAFEEYLKFKHTATKEIELL